MKFNFFCISIFLLLNLPLFSQNETDVKQHLKKQKWGLSLESGALIKNHNQLSTILYGNNNTLETGIYFQSSAGIIVDWQRFYFLFSGTRAFYDTRINAADNLRVRESQGGFNMGYNVVKNKKIGLVPYLGILESVTEITLSKSTNTKSVSSYLAGAADTYFLQANNYYGSAGLLFTYEVNPLDGAFMAPFTIGLRMEYQQRISDTDWSDASGNELNSTNVFDQSVLLAFSMGFWL